MISQLTTLSSNIQVGYWSTIPQSARNGLWRTYREASEGARSALGLAMFVRDATDTSRFSATEKETYEAKLSALTDDACSKYREMMELAKLPVEPDCFETRE